MNFLSEHNIYIFLVQIFLLLGLARGLGELFQKYKQPPLSAEILVGILLGPTILGRFFPQIHQYIFPADIVQQNMLETVSWIGILFLLLVTGLEIDFTSAWKQKDDALKLAILDVIIPMIIAFTCCIFLPDKYLVNPEKRIIFALFISTIMTISAMPIAARALHDLKILKTDLGFLIMSALSINDIIGWLLFTIIFTIFLETGLFAFKIFSVLAITLVFALICLTIGRKITSKIISLIKEKQLDQSGLSLTFIAVLGVLCGAITQKIGIHALFGFFIAGIMAGGAKALSEKTRHTISQMVYALFVPLFFANIGLKVDFLANFDLLIVSLITIVGIAGRFLGAYWGVFFTKLNKCNRLPVAVAHTPGGTMEVVIALLAFENGLITETMFVAIVFSALASSVILGPWLNYALKARKEVSILEFFFRRGIIADIKSKNKEEAIEHLCKTASELEGSYETEELFAHVMKREYDMGTALEEGIAVPHARIPHFKKPIVIFGRSLTGIEWDSPDGKPTNFIFLILTLKEEVETQVQILSLIARKFSQKEVREKILQTHNSDEIWEIIQKTFSNQNIINSKPNIRNS